MALVRRKYAGNVGEWQPTGAKTPGQALRRRAGKPCWKSLPGSQRSLTSKEGQSPGCSGGWVPASPAQLLGARPNTGQSALRRLTEPGLWMDVIAISNYCKNACLDRGSYLMTSLSLHGHSSGRGRRNNHIRAVPVTIPNERKPRAVTAINPKPEGDSPPSRSQTPIPKPS